MSGLIFNVKKNCENKSNDFCSSNNNSCSNTLDTLLDSKFSKTKFITSFNKDIKGSIWSKGPKNLLKNVE